MLNDGAVPGIGDGFARFVAVPTINEQIQTNLEKQLREAKTNPYDSHPPLRDRIAAAEKTAGGGSFRKTGIRRGVCWIRRRRWSCATWKR